MSNDTSLKNVSIEKFSASDGVLHYALMSLPIKHTKTVVLHVHGLGGSFYGSTGVEELSHSLASKGYAFISIQTRGSYIIESFDRLKGKKRTSFFAGSALEKFEDCIYDIEGAINFLSSKGYKNIILEGHSIGCQKIIYYVTKKRDNRIKGLILLSPVDVYNFVKTVRGSRFNKDIRFARNVTNGNAFIPNMPSDIPLMSASRFMSIANPKRPESKIMNYKMKNMLYISKIKVPTLVVLGEDDYFMNLAGIKVDYAVDKLQENCQFLKGVIIKGADHQFENKSNILTKTVLSWINKN